jgi:hypothetical protein
MRLELRLSRFAGLLVPLLLVLSCGVTFGSDFEGTELFEELQVAGERVAGAQLTVNLFVTQAYPVPVKVACYYEDAKLSEEDKKVNFEERARFIGETVLPPAAGRKPDDEVPAQRLSFTFSIAEPGRYFLACLTPGAAENGIGVSMTIRAPRA